MVFKKQQAVVKADMEEKKQTPVAVAEEILEKKLDNIATMLCQSETDKSRIYGEIIEMVERSLFRIALRRSNHVKSTAAAYLGINRNTFQKKMISLGIEPNSK